eukprot:3308124-Alexandrium_andersonii.AAC.1
MRVDAYALRQLWEVSGAFVRRPTALGPSEHRQQVFKNNLNASEAAKLIVDQFGLIQAAG